jgi:hypothetical protein
MQLNNVQVAGVSNADRPPVSPSGAANPPASRRNVMHMPWQRMVTHRVMAQLDDGQVMLVYVSTSREEAVSRAAEAVRELPDNAVTLYTECRVGGLENGHWEILRPRQGGYYRTFRPRRSRPERELQGLRQRDLRRRNRPR